MPLRSGGGPDSYSYRPCGGLGYARSFESDDLSNKRVAGVNAAGRPFQFPCALGFGIWTCPPRGAEQPPIQLQALALATWP